MAQPHESAVEGYRGWTCSWLTQAEHHPGAGTGLWDFYSSPSTTSVAAASLKRQRSLLVIGEALMDTVRRPDGSVQSFPGGSPTNVAITLGRLGRAPRLLTWIGNDPAGRAISCWLEQSGVALDERSWGAPRTSSAVADIDNDGVATYSIDLSWEARIVDSEQVDLVHCGSVSALHEPGAATLRDFLARHRNRFTITYDPNVRPVLMGGRQRAKRDIEHLVTLADVVKVSDEDLSWLAPKSAPLELARKWNRLGPAIVIVTHGRKGATAVAGANEVHVPSQAVQVVDTVGAGDTFMGAVIDGLLDQDVIGSDRRAVLGNLSEAQLAGLLSHAVNAAAITVARAGANPPWRGELGATVPVVAGYPSDEVRRQIGARE